MEPHERFARNLRRVRVEKGLTQEAAAEVCDLHRTEIGLLERGQRDPQLRTVVRLARGLNVPVMALLDGVE